ncbi:alpha-2-macroglobulin [Lentimicrobium sp. S6]|uniref:alpha-2-macroglobulin family protein n=1 Tax=Lentimicrobium sp. S6 TaxID=2735872 RepID=UPI001556CCAD|nr:alpha-2-macroglobulin family protein [Lentimicrobium sp. S6]NPD46670.1 hypothetical protein [Lentimicrobium sp. S6]
MMKSLKILFIGLSILIGNTMMAQTFDFEKSWKQINDLEKKGLSAQALEQCQIIFIQAQKEDNSVQLIKSLIYKSNFRQAYEEEALKKSIGEIKEILSASNGIEKALLSIALSDLYQQYYQRNQWDIRGRLHVSGRVAKDLEAWSQENFREEKEKLISAALAEEGLLMKSPSEPWKEIFLDQEKDFKTFPTLFDFVAWKAIAFYSASEFSNSAQEDLVILNQVMLFGDDSQFVNVIFNDFEAKSAKVKTIQLFQKLIKKHQGNKTPNAFLYAESQRIAYLKSNGQIDDKESLLLKTLNNVFENYKGQAGSEFLAEELINQYKWNTGNEYDLRKAEAICQAMIEVDRNSKYFKGVLTSLQAKELNISMDGVILPNQAAFSTISFQNMTQAWFKIIQLSEDEIIERNSRGEDQISKYLNSPLIAEFDYALTVQNYLSAKKALFELPQLGVGHYAIIASTGPDFNLEKDQLRMGEFWVTGLQLISRGNDGHFLIVDRETGKPIDKAKVEVYSSQWEYSTRTNLSKLEETITSGKDGTFQYMNVNGKQITFIISKGQDEWKSGNVYVRDYRENARKNEKHYFFTDRAIYRPGQKVYFKGIFTNQKKNDVEPIAKLSKEVKLYSTNGKVIQTINVTSNEFGSVAGSFVLPLSGLTGNMRISDGKGSVSFKMEEYKRPKFEVNLESPSVEFQLNDQVSLSGNATYFAGIGVQNAKVKYRISRAVFMPWRWGFWPQIEDLDISAGEVSTNEQGEFEISFLALAPYDIEFLPWFNYQITAEVSDESGETHTASMDIRLGKQSILISTNLPEVMDLEHPKDVEVKAETPNGKKLNSQIHFKLEKLITKEKLSRLVKVNVDTLLISPEKLKKDYKDFVFAQKRAPLKIEATVLEKTLQTEIDSIIPKSIFQSLPIGSYKMTLSTVDKNGIEVKDTASFKIFSSKENKLASAEEFFHIMNHQNAKVGDTLHFSFGSSVKNPQYYYQLSSGSEMITSSWYKVSKGLNHISIPITENYRGGLSLQLFFVANNQVHDVSQNISIPFDNKELKVELITFRSPMEPGTKEHWKLKIRNRDGAQVDAEVLAAMYDASLDVFQENNWTLWPYHPKNNPFNWSSLGSYFSETRNRYDSPSYPSFSNPSPLELAFTNSSRNNRIMYSKMAGAGAMPMMDGMKAEADMDSEAIPEQPRSVAITNMVIEEEPENPKTEPKPVTPRKNLEETAFFYPQLKTDMAGQVSLNFVSPEALTRWKLMVMATTQDMEIGHFTQEVVTQKELMVMPNLPRFLRGGDQMTLSTKILNLLEEEQVINAELEILDAATKEPLNMLVSGQVSEQSLSISAKGQAEVSWSILVPEEIGAVIIRVLAQGPAHSDGEEHILPVLSQLHFLTDTYPFCLSTQNSITPEELSLREVERPNQDELTLEITTNPLWYVVQALPNYALPQKPNALSWFNYYFIHAMASDIVKTNPEIQEVFKQWQQLSPEELESELFQNPELKKVMIEETPWVFNAENQSLRKREIARLFDENNLNYQLESALMKLQELQKSNGGFSWIDGMPTSTYISAEISAGLGQLLEAGIINPEKEYAIKNLIKNLVKYLDDEIEINYQKALNKKTGYSAHGLVSARAYFIESYPLKEKQIAFDYFLNKMTEKKHQKSLSQKMGLARILWYNGRFEEANELMAALKDISLTDENGGIYWRDFQRYESVRKQAEMISLFSLAKTDDQWIEGMKLWLLQQKRANDWGDNKATAQACFAMLNGSTALSNSPKVYLIINGEEQLIDGNAGTGYFKITWRGNEIPKALEGFEIRKEGKGMIFGAFYDQYFEKMSEIDAHEGGVELQKQVFVAKTEDGKNELLALEDGAKIELGDRIVVRMILNNKQAMDFVHLRDYLPAGFENQNPLSGYHWQGSISYYQAPGDVATDYFIYHLPKGKFVIEYELNATISGKLNLGPAEVQSIYAPEFGGHSEGGFVEVIK